MSLKHQQHERFRVLMAGDIGIDHRALKHHGRNITVANQCNNVLTLVETTPFDLIILELTVNGSGVTVPDRLRHFRHPWQSEFLARIKDPLGINNKTPVIAVINPTEGSQRERHYSMEFDDSLIRPITEEQLNKIIALWQTKASASDYIQILLSKTKNNQRLALTIFEKLFEELPLQINGIKDALKNKHYDAAKEITHKLNGSVSFCGLLEIQQPASALESCLLNNDYAAVNQHFLMLRQCILNLTRHQKLILANLEQLPTL